MCGVYIITKTYLSSLLPVNLYIFRLGLLAYAFLAVFNRYPTCN